MKVLLAASEAVPFVKTGGLADTVGSLAVALARQGVQSAVILPCYRRILQGEASLGDPVATVRIPICDVEHEGTVYRTRVPNTDVPAYLVRHDGFFGRGDLYGAYDDAYGDNAARFVFFSRAIVETIQTLALDLDIVQLADWQTALAAMYMKTTYGWDKLVRWTPTILAIHNLAFQGRFSRDVMPALGLPHRHVNEMELEYWGDVNFLKAGIVYANAIVTVSPAHARDIQTAQGGFGLDGILRERSDRLFGVLNGIDTDLWNPCTDRMIAANYAADDLAGKAACKKALLAECGLEREGDAPLVGMICRLHAQKGLDLVAEAIDAILDLPVRMVVLGMGDAHCENLLADVAARRPGQFALRARFDEEMAHRIEAGADFFLMPSAYEPCGLNQMYSMRYGTIPIVRATGGLADTVTDAAGDRDDGVANGFTFSDYSARALVGCVRRAVALYRDDPERTLALRRNGMRADLSWRSRAGEYITLYKEIAGDAAC